jgi:isopentenyl-diphosphate Delta-isomerase
LTDGKVPGRAEEKWTVAAEIDVLDEYGLRTGEVLSRAEVHRLGKPHRVVRLYLFDRSNRLLLQRRSNRTDHGRGVLTISLLAHLDAGESSSATVRREVEEELGLDASAMDFEFLFSYRRDAELRPDYIDRQFNDIYACWAEFRLEEIVLDRNEASEVKLVSVEEFQAMTKDPSSGLAPYYADEFRDLIYLLRARFAPPTQLKCPLVGHPDEAGR